MLALSLNSAWANVPNYNYLDAAWLKFQPDQAASVESQGYRLQLASPLEPGNYLHASYSRIEDDNDAKASLLSVGLGAWTSLQRGVDGYAVLSYEDIDNKASASRPEVDDKGGSLEMGLRWAVARRLQLDLGGRYIKLDKAGEETQWFAETLLHISPGLALSGRYTWAEADARYSVGLRLFQR